VFPYGRGVDGVGRREGDDVQRKMPLGRSLAIGSRSLLGAAASVAVGSYARHGAVASVAGGSRAVKVANSEATQWTIEGLTVGATVEVTATGVNDGGEGPASGAVSVVVT
jgi:hypothetical protein